MLMATISNSDSRAALPAVLFRGRDHRVELLIARGCDGVREGGLEIRVTSLMPRSALSLEGDQLRIAAAHRRDHPEEQSEHTDDDEDDYTPAWRRFYGGLQIAVAVLADDRGILNLFRAKTAFRHVLT